MPSCVLAQVFHVHHNIVPITGNDQGKKYELADLTFFLIFEGINRNLSMGKHTDIRWVQRMVNFQRSLNMLSRYLEKEELTDLEKPGLIKLFETTFEQAWLTIKDFYEDQGESNIQGSRDAFRMAHQRGLIPDGQAWMEMIESRKLTVHTYNEKTAEKVEEAVEHTYYALFNQLLQNLQHHLPENE